jgi:hypothetical protein
LVADNEAITFRTVEPLDYARFTLSYPDFSPFIEFQFNIRQRFPNRPQNVAIAWISMTADPSEINICCLVGQAELDRSQNRHLKRIAETKQDYAQIWTVEALDWIVCSYSDFLVDPAPAQATISVFCQVTPVAAESGLLYPP